MRYTNRIAFDKHLSDVGPHHLSHLFLICSSDDFERKQSIDAVLSFIQTPDAIVTRLAGAEMTARQIVDALNSPNLFGGESVVVVDEADKKLIEDLSPHFKELQKFGYLILGTKGKAGSSGVEAVGSVLDLTEEKPWEKEKRWTEMLHEKARAAGKRLTPDAALWMIERLEKDAALLSHEMDKLLCHTAGKSTIERSDVEMICCASRTFSLWVIAEDLVWGQVFRGNWADLRESSFFHGLLASSRQQLMIGLKMHLLERGRVPMSEWGRYFPKMWPKTLEKRAHSARQLGFDYFRKNLDRLFEMELLAKNSQVPLDALFDLFRLRCAS